MSELTCRGCGADVHTSLVDLGVQPLSNAYVRSREWDAMEAFYPLHPMVCEQCFLVQIGVFEPPERIFTDYAYLSSFSTSWLDHCARHVETSIARLGLTSSSFVVEVASNDGYLLRSFRSRDIPVLGIEPADNVAAIARKNGVPTRTLFFGAANASAIADEYGAANMILANNVLAHVPDIHDFVEGFRRLLAPDGVATFEFPHLVPMLEETQFDTIYHEHFSYLSLLALEPIFASHALRVISIDRLTTHGGSLRLWVAHESSSHRSDASVESVRNLEDAAGISRLDTYRAFGARTRKIKNELLRFLIGAADRDERVVAYGAAAKGNTLLNYCGIKDDFIDFVVDRNPHKQGMLLPGSRLRIEPVEALIDARPSHILILPWNLRDEICEQMSMARQWGARFIVAIPELTVI